MPTPAYVVGLSILGIAAGLFLLARGFGGYRVAGRVSGTSPSRIASLAAGEVLVTGTADAIEVTLVSPLQSRPCLYYRSRITESRDGDGQDLLAEDRAVGFRVRDSTGAVRVFPSGARFDVPDRYDESTPMLGGDPIGYVPRTGPAFAPGPADRDAQIAALLTVQVPPMTGLLDRGGLPLGHSDGRRHYREARIEPGEVVTVLGRVVPFSDLADPAAAFLLDASAVGPDDPEVAGDLAEARAAGLLAATPEEAWGNAAIPGFGIGQPVRAPELDPLANRPPAPDPELAARAAAAFEIPPNELVLVTSDEVPMQVSLGAPAAVAARGQAQFIVGLLGAVLAIASAMVLAVQLSGGLR